MEREPESRTRPSIRTVVAFIEVTSIILKGGEWEARSQLHTPGLFKDSP
jgi:hypothetical protein